MESKQSANNRKRQRRVRLPHEKTVHKALIDADLTLTDIAAHFGVSLPSLNVKVLRGDISPVMTAIRELQTSRKQLAKSA